MKFQKYQAIFSSDATWAQDIVRYSTLKKLIKSYVRMTNTEEQISSSSQKPVKAVQSKPREGGGILAELENMEDESSEDEETFQTFNKEEAQEKVTRLLKEDIERSNRRFVEDLSNVRAYAKALADSSEAPSEEDLQQLRLRIKNCFDYARIQEEAFDCILRKWDKVMNVENDCSLNGETFMAELRKEPFMDHSCLDEELNISQQLMMRLVEAKAQGTNEVNYSDADMDKRITVDSMDIGVLSPCCKHRFWLTMIEDAFGCHLRVPVIVVKGAYVGPVVCVTACVHGNELNGVPLVHKLVDDIDPTTLVGTIVAIPVVNGPGYLENKRGFSDGVDLNRCFPGQPDGTRSKQYAYAFIQKVIKNVDYLIDLHTASHGRVNSLYVRADLLNPIAKQMALLQNPMIVVHNSSPGGSLRGAAQAMGIPAITVEIGDPAQLQYDMILAAYQGVRNILTFLNMLTEEGNTKPPRARLVLCTSSKWFYTDSGGILVVHPDVGTWIRSGQVFATIFDSFGDRVKEFIALEDAVVVGKSCNPVASAGDRIVHLGFVGSTLNQGQLDGHE